MKRPVTLGVLALAAAALGGGSSVRGEEAPPAWAYVVNPPDFRPPPDDGRLRHVPDSTAAFTLTQVRDLFSAPDWHPGDHLPMPEVVARGRKPGVFACGLADFRSGARVIALSREVTDAEVAAAAEYFSTIMPRSNISVVETASVPTTFVTGWHLAAAKSADREPLGQRIVEVPEELEQDAAMWRLPRPRVEGAWPHSRDRGTLTELLRPPVVRLQARSACGDGQPIDGAHRGEAHARRHDLACGLRSVSQALRIESARPWGPLPLEGERFVSFSAEGR